MMLPLPVVLVAARAQIGIDFLVRAWRLPQAEDRLDSSLPFMLRTMQPLIRSFSEIT
jgi:hypothetical protein